MAVDPRLIDEARLSANEFLFDEAIRHQIRIERFSAGARRRIIGFLDNQMIPDLLERLEGRLNRIASRGFRSGVFQTQRFRDLVAGTSEIVRAARSEVSSMLRGDLIDLSSTTAEWQVDRIRRAFRGTLPPNFMTPLPNPELLRSVVTSRPFQGRFLREHWAEWDRRTQLAVRDSIRLGIAEGDSVAEIVRRLRGTRAAMFTDGALQTSRRGAERIVRTAVTHVSSHAREAAFESNRRVIRSVQWVSTLDSRTSQICAALDSRTFSVGSGPRPPAHPNCRSTIVPVLKSFDELGIPGLREPTSGTRSARGVLDGRVPERTTFGEWWRRLSKADQDAQFGVGKARLLREGKIRFRDLIDQRNRPLSLAELREKAGLPAT